MKQTEMFNFGALTRPYPALIVTAATSGVAITAGDVLDRSLIGYAGSAALVVEGSYTIASGAAGDAIVVAGTVSTSASLSSGALVTPSTLKTFSVSVPWVSSATLRRYCIAVPLGFNSANEYIQLSSLTLTATSAGGTYSALTARAVWATGGEYSTPDPLFNSAGYLSYGT
jgi:hypothetical protein